MGSGALGEETAVISPPAEETEYEYSGSEEEDDSHGEEGEPRWAWQAEVGDHHLPSAGTTVVLGLGTQSGGGGHRQVDP